MEAGETQGETPAVAGRGCMTVALVVMHGEIVPALADMGLNTLTDGAAAIAHRVGVISADAAGDGGPTHWQWGQR